MQNDSNIAKENVALENFIGTKSEIIETSINIADKNIDKILSVSSCFYLDNAETLVGEITYNGTLSINLVYEDNNNQILSHQASMQLNSRFENNLFNVGGATRIIPNIISTEVEKLTNNNASIKTNLELSFFNVFNQEIDVFSGGDENVFLLQSEIPLSNFVAKNCSQFSQQIILDSKDEIDSILSLQTSAILKKAEALDNILIVEGETFVNALVKTKEEKPTYVTLSRFENFREEIEDSNVKKDFKVETCARIVCENVKTNISEDNKTIETTLPINVCYNVYETRNVTVVNDAYSVKNEITLTTSGFNSTLVLGNECFDFRFDGNITLSDELPRIDKILAVDGAYLTLTNSAYQNKELLVEGIIHANVIYLNDDENTINSLLVEIPFSQTERTNIDDDNITAKLTFILYDVDAIAKKGREISLDGKIKVCASLTKEVSNAIISNISFGDEVEASESAIEIYFANAGQTLWDIAKDLRVSKEILASQNPELPEIMLGEEKIIYYNQQSLE